MADQPSRSKPDRTPVIPDGGLSASGLPDWMQVKPSWTDQPAVSASVTVVSREVPAPDTSTIDLASMLATEDLPGWLQEVARRPVQDGVRLANDAALPGTLEIRGQPVETIANSVPETSDLMPQPWWASDRVMAGLLVAVVLTILFVLITTVRLT